ncbi:MAG TPA: PilZ domain-containing protein [Vicinamibacterales bacterium]|nr:PilZ domain-containing protein [Vicinamibacterales bacterium]
MTAIERRRHLRVDVPSGDGVQFEVRRRIQLLDISLSGALLACDMGVPVGTVCQIRAGLSASPFTARVQVRREHPPGSTRSPQRALGAMFLSMDEVSRRSLEEFLRRASE